MHGRLHGAVGVLFGTLFYSLYWQRRDFFDSNGRYFDPVESVVYHDDAAIWLGPVLLCALVAVLCVRYWKRRK